MVTDTLKNHLCAARKKLDLSQTQVAAILGLKSASRVCELESGGAMPTVRDCVAFQVLFKRSFEELWPLLHLEIEAATDSNIRRVIDRLQKAHMWSQRKRARANVICRNLAIIVDGLPEDVAELI